MKLEIMETAAKNTKPIWDSIVALFGGGFIFLQSAVSLELVTWAQVFGSIGIGIFGFMRAYYWWKHDGYEDGGPND